ncbi:MAG: extracellular solute-binding protein [bacterium]|nr:extracellular solute-binding protein [bacterium]
MAEEKIRYKPLYDQVKDLLLKRVIDGIYKKGETIPGESNLADELGTSVYTVRQAISLLVANGILIKKQGKRTYVSDQKIKLSFFTWMPETPRGEKIVLETIELFHKKNPSFAVECIPTTYPMARKELMKRIITGNAPDVAQIVPHWTSYFASMGAFERLDTLLDKNNLADRFADKDLCGGRYHDKLYSVAWGLCPLLLIANKSVLREAGIQQIDSPVTLDTLIALCGKIDCFYQKKETYCYGLNISYDEIDFMFICNFLKIFNGGFANEQGEVVFNSRENVTGLRWLRDFVRNFKILKTDIFTIRKRFARGEVAFMADGPWTKYLMEELTGEAFDKNFEVLLNPVQTGEQSFSWNFNHSLAICSQSENKLYAAKFINTLTGDNEISNYYYSQTGLLPVHKKHLENPQYNSAFYDAFKTQLCNTVCMNAENAVFGRAVVFCVDAMSKILFQDVDIEKELDEKEYYLNMLYKEVPGSAGS